jgi:hypothetical protein
LCRDYPINGVESRPVFNFGVSSNRPAKVTGDAFSAGFPSSPGVPDRRQLDQEILVTRYRHSRAAVPFGKCPNALTALGIVALIDSGAVVVESTSNLRVVLKDRHESSPGGLAEPDHGPVSLPHSAVNSADRSFVACSGGAV